MNYKQIITEAQKLITADRFADGEWTKYLGNDKYENVLKNFRICRTSIN